MRYEGPIYRPPSEADSLLIQATVGCPHNQCTFCMVYKNGPPFRVRPAKEILEDLEQAAIDYGTAVTSLFFPAGNTIAMPGRDLATICRSAYQLLPRLERITVYGSFQYLHAKGPEKLRQLAEAGLSRIHVGLETGDDQLLQQICKGTCSTQQMEAGRWVIEAGIELSLYVLLGIGGTARSAEHAEATARVLNAIAPDFTRLRTLLPKANTPLLNDIHAGAFTLLGPHQILHETRQLLSDLHATTYLTSDHYTNYINLEGRLPMAAERLIKEIDQALLRPEDTFRPIYIGTQ